MASKYIDNNLKLEKTDTVELGVRDYSPSGSVGMQSGLIVGCQAAGSGLPVIEMNVSRGRKDIL